MSTLPRFHGTSTALVTPFRDGAIDETALRRLVEEQIASGIDGLVAVGTTGESPTLDPAEHLRVIEIVVAQAAGRVPVIAGAGANSTKEAVHLSIEAAKLGADALLHVTPYYNKPSQAGLLAHFGAVAEATELPIILYSIPGRCVIEVGIQTTAKLAETVPTIIGIKESGAIVERVTALRQAVPTDFLILSGDDSATLPAIATGAQGVISVASNLLPGPIREFVATALAGNMAEAEALHRKFTPLFKTLFIEPNPVPAKAALARRGWMTEDVRLPLTPMEPATRAKLEPVLDALSL